MNNFEQSVTNFTRGANLLPTEIANAAEKNLGIEVGTKQSFLLVKGILEKYIEQTEDALSQLNDDRHQIAVLNLSNTLKYFREALADVQRQLDSGDHLRD